MIQYHIQSSAPHLRVELAGTLSEEEVARELGPLPDDLATVPENFVGLVVYPDLRHIEEPAVGPMFYAATHLLHARPALCVFVNGGHHPHPGLREYIEQLARDGQVVFVDTEADAAAHIEQSGRPRSSAPDPSA
jgi:hypothetical protein